MQKKLWKMIILFPEFEKSLLFMFDEKYILGVWFYLLDWVESNFSYF